jgi:hypothetical protein
MALTYQSGEEIKKGDRVLYFRHLGVIEFVVTEHTGESNQDWYVDDFGGGVMVIDDAAGRTFISPDQVAECDELEFKSRAGP